MLCCRTVVSYEGAPSSDDGSGMVTSVSLLLDPHSPFYTMDNIFTHARRTSKPDFFVIL